MGKRVYFEDITTLALLYHYEATESHSRMLPHSMIKEYDRIIDKNLDEINSSIDIVYPLNTEKLIYKNTQDENGNWYSILKYDLDMEEERYNAMYNTASDLVIASQMPNALAVLGIQLINGKMKKRVNQENRKEIQINLNNILERIAENPQEFHKKIANLLSPQEKEFIIEQIQNKSCLNCTNGSCSVQSYEKTIDTCCVAWTNQELIGRQLLLTKNN